MANQFTGIVSSRADKHVVCQCFRSWANFIENVKLHTASELMLMEAESQAAARIADIEAAAAEQLLTSETRAIEHEQHIAAMAALIAEVKEQLSVAQAEVEKCHQQRDKLSWYHTNHSARMLVWHSFAAWHKETLRLRHHPQLLRQALGRLQKKSQGRAFVQWSTWVKDCATLKQKRFIVVRRLMLSTLAKAFDGWSSRMCRHDG